MSLPLPAVSPERRHFGFRGSVRFDYGSSIVHAITKRDHHLTVCGRLIDKRDHWHMNTNGMMELPNCLYCWVMRDP